MRVTTYGQYLTQITQFPVVFPISAYLVREDDGFTLIDTGFNNAKGILDTAQKLNAPIRRILLTHAHSDHVGSVDALHEALPQAEVIISARDARFLAGERSLDPDEPQTQLRGGYVTIQTRPTRLLSPGDRIGSLQAVASPGHTPGHMAFFDTRDRSLIAGDAFQSQGGLVVAGGFRLIFPISPFATWNRPLSLESARALRALNPSRLAVGHGPVLENPLAAMDAAIGEAAEKVERGSAHV